MKTFDENTLFIGGAANEAGAGIYAVTLVRSACKHIVGFSGTAKKIANAPYIDGGLVYGGGGTLMFTAWPPLRGRSRARRLVPKDRSA